jgi:hypothetical protein
LDVDIVVGRGGVEMTVRDLSRLLYDLQVPPTLYRLDGSHFELAHVIARQDGAWIVFLSERGGESDTVDFVSEHDACVHLLGRITLELIDRQILRVEAQP